MLELIDNMPNDMFIMCVMGATWLFNCLAGYVD